MKDPLGIQNGKNAYEAGLVSYEDAWSPEH